MVNSATVLGYMRTHLIANTEGHLRNLNVDEGVVHGSPLLHLIDVIDRMLMEEISVNHIITFCLLLT